MLIMEEVADGVDSLQHEAAASWIWSDRAADEIDRMAQFRLTFEWDGSGDVWWLGFADTLYTIWCNGHVLGVGPVASVSEKPYLTRWVLGGYARRGRNVLALQVWSTAGDLTCGDVCSLEGGVIGWLRAGRQLVATGERWRARDAYRYNRPEQQVDEPGGSISYGNPAKDEARCRLLLADLREEPLDWMNPEYQESGDGWQAARLVHTFDHPRREQLRMSPVPPLTCERLPVPRLMDAGWATSGPPVTRPWDVASRMARQELESLLCPRLDLRAPVARVSPYAVGRPDPQRMGWESLELPWVCRDPGEERELYLTVDLGRETSGTTVLDIECERECTVDIGYADHLQDRRVIPTRQFHLAERVILPVGRQVLRLPHDRGYRYLQLTLSAGATIHELYWEEHVYPHDRTPRFHSSDAGLNAVWQAAADTVRQVSLWNYVDNAWRERKPWLGPNLVNAWRGGYAVAGDLDLIRKNLIDGLDYGAQREDNLIATAALGNNNGPWQRMFDTHDLIFPQIARDYIMHSDDRDLARELTQASASLVEHQSVFTEAGLKAPTDPGRTLAFSGWNFNAGHSVITAHNLMFIEAVRNTAWLHRYLGDDGRAKALEARETPLLEALFRELIDEEHGVLCQGLDAEGRPVPFCSQHDNARALRLGVVPDVLHERFHRFCAGASGTWPTNRSAWQGADPTGEHVRYRADQMVAAGSQFESFAVIEAIAALESPQAAIDYIRYNFGAMIDEGPGTFWECWTEHVVSEDTCSYSQSWGTAVAYQILLFGLGARVVAPGGSQIEWRPRRIAVERVSAKLRTIHGDVTLGWNGDDLYWDVPRNVRLRVCPPESDERVVEGPSQHGTIPPPFGEGP
ncbi:MAG: hypothetical protein ACOCX2_00025 [Armatimonadota bacterium]